MGHIRVYYERVADLSQSDWQYIAALFECVRFSKGETVTEQGDVEQFLYFIESGIIRYYVCDDTTETTFDFCFEKAFASAYDSLVNQTPSSYRLSTLFTLFVVDSKPTFENYTAEERSRYFPQGDEGITETFINARITQRFEETWEDEEGCLSIPSLHRKVERPWSIEVEYTDRHFVKQHRMFSGITARMIQHEYDHTQGILYLDYLQPLTRKMLESKLRKISKGHISVNYPMRFRK